MVPKTEYAPYFERYMQLTVLKDKTIIQNLKVLKMNLNAYRVIYQIINIVILMLQESGR